MKPARELFATAVGSTTVIVVGVTAWCLVLPLGVTKRCYSQDFEGRGASWGASSERRSRYNGQRRDRTEKESKRNICLSPTWGLLAFSLLFPTKSRKLNSKGDYKCLVPSEDYS